MKYLTTFGNTVTWRTTCN